jgi:methionyl-tRNA formyltransferase
MWKKEPFKITAAQISTDHDLPVGSLLIIESSVLVGVADGSIEILSVVPAGKKEMTAAEWARGARISGGELLG